MGSIALVPGASPVQVGIFLVVVTVTMVMFMLVGNEQPYLLSQVMHIPAGQQGRVTGLLQMVQYGAVALFIIPAGGLSDSLGRKPVLIAAMGGFVLTLLVMPFCASVGAMIVARALLGASSTGHTTGGATMMVDFPTNASRGKFIALMLVVQSVIGAAVVGWLLPRVPHWLMSRGLSETWAFRGCLFGVAAAGAAAILFGLLMLRPPPAPKAAMMTFATALTTAREVLAHSRSDPAFGLVVLAAFVIRSDYFVTLAYLNLWVMNAAKLHGVSPLAAQQLIGTLFIVLNISLAVSPLLFGFVADRVNRLWFLIVSLLATAAVFAATTLVGDVRGLGMVVVVALIGLAETAQTIASQAVFGERAPPALRGSSMSFLVLMGTISVIVMSWLSGILFDKLGFTAPFVFLAGLNIDFAAVAAVLVLRQKRRGGLEPIGVTL